MSGKGSPKLICLKSVQLSSGRLFVGGQCGALPMQTSVFAPTRFLSTASQLHSGLQVGYSRPHENHAFLAKHKRRVSEMAIARMAGLTRLPLDLLPSNVGGHLSPYCRYARGKTLPE